MAKVRICQIRYTEDPAILTNNAINICNGYENPGQYEIYSHVLTAVKHETKW